MRLLLVLLAALAASAAPPTPEAQLDRAEEAVLVLGLRPAGVAEEDARMLSAQLAEVLAQRSGQRVITVDEIDELVQHQKNLSGMSCESDACIAEMSKVANARHALTGSVGRIGDSIVVSLSLVDVEATRAVGNASRTLASIDEVLAVLPELLAEVFHWEDAEPATRPRFALPEGQQLSLAVFDIKPLGLTEAAAQNLTQVLASEIKQVRGTSVISRDDVASMLEMEAQRDSMACESATGTSPTRPTPCRASSRTGCAG